MHNTTDMKKIILILSLVLLGLSTHSYGQEGSAIKGKVKGVRVQPSNVPGSGPQIQIRGESSAQRIGTVYQRIGFQLFISSATGAGGLNPSGVLPMQWLYSSGEKDTNGGNTP